MNNLKKQENDIQLLRILQRRHIFQRPVEMLVKVRINSNDRNHKHKEIWLSKTYIQSQEGGKFLIEEFSKTKVSERGVDMYLGKRRSNTVQSNNKQTDTTQTSISSSLSNNNSTNKLKKTSSLPSTSILLSADTSLSKDTEYGKNVNNSSNLRIKKSNTSNNINKSFKSNPKSSNNFKLLNIRNNLKNRRINSLNKSKKKNCIQDSNEAFEDGNTCSDDGVTYTLNRYPIKKVDLNNDKKNDLLSEANTPQSNEKVLVLLQNDQQKQTSQNHLAQKNKSQNKKKSETLKKETKRKRRNSDKDHEANKRISLMITKEQFYQHPRQKHIYHSNPPRLYPILDAYPEHPIIAAYAPKNLTPPEGSSESERRSSVRQTEGETKFKDLVIRRYPGYLQIILWTRMQIKDAFKNAFNPSVFNELCIVLRKAIYDETKVVLLTGSSDIFSSGIDLHYLTESEVDRPTAARKMVDSLREFINTLISFPKPLVVAVNGPALGLATAFLPLFDIVYASDKASFSCTYVKLCQTPEGCASHTFPRIMGIAMANELLMRGRRITALEANQIGLVSQVFWPEHLMAEVIPRVQQLAQQSSKALEYSKELIRCRKRGKLETVNSMECRLLVERWASNECQQAMRSFLDNTSDIL